MDQNAALSVKACTVLIWTCFTSLNLQHLVNLQRFLLPSRRCLAPQGFQTIEPRFLFRQQKRNKPTTTKTGEHLSDELLPHCCNVGSWMAHMKTKRFKILTMAQGSAGWHSAVYFTPQYRPKRNHSVLWLMCILFNSSEKKNKKHFVFTCQKISQCFLLESMIEKCFFSSFSSAYFRKKTKQKQFQLFFFLPNRFLTVCDASWVINPGFHVTIFGCFMLSSSLLWNLSAFMVLPWLTFLSFFFPFNQCKMWWCE